MVDPTGLYFINDDDPLASVGIGGGDLGGGGVAGGFGPGDSPCICYNPTPDPTIGGSASNSGSDIPSGTDCSANPTVCSVTVKMLTPPDDSLDGSIAGQMRNDPLSMAILNSASDWVEAGAAYTAIVFGGILTGAASESVIGLAQSVDVSMPGVFDGLADIFNVMSPIPSVGTTEAGLIVNGAAIANQIIDHSQEIQDSVYQGWQWFNGDPVNESDKP